MPKPKLPRKDIEWKSDLAYAIGLITTDGNLSSDGRHISLTSSDIQLLNTFKKCLGKKHSSIGTIAPSSISRKQAYRVQIGDVVLYDWLTRLGLHPNKSLSLGSLNISRKFFADFVRGHLDGDGSIIYYKDAYNSHINPDYIYDRLIIYLMSASKIHIKWLRKMISSILGIFGSIQVRPPGKSTKGKNECYVLKFSTKESKVLLNWIYYKPNLPCLKRKYYKAKPFLNYNRSQSTSPS